MPCNPQINERGCSETGQPLPQTLAATQTTIALSSGDSEVGSMCEGASQLIGMQGISAELSISFELQVGKHATAAMGMSGRLGICH